MKIGFIGVGVVGGAIKKAFEPLYDVVAYDKFKPELGTKEAVLKADVIFVSVPTATDYETGAQDLSPLIETLDFLMLNQFKGVVIVKSTVVPGTCKELGTYYNLKVVHSPEFLTAKNPHADFIKQTSVLLGGDEEDVKKVVPIFKRLNPFITIKSFSDSTVTEMAKYMHNLFLATKVSFCNEIYEVCQHLGVSYEEVKLGALSVGQVGESHTSVPGPDGKLGYGGMCFPKDTVAFDSFVKNMGLYLPVLSGAILGNGKRRKGGGRDEVF